MASPTRWMWVWENSGSWWWTGRPGVVQFMGSQRIGHDWATELNWTESIQIQYAKHTILVDLIVSGSQCLKLQIVTCLWLSVYRHCIYSKEHKTEKQATLRSVCTKSKIDIKPYASWFNILAQSLSLFLHICSIWYDSDCLKRWCKSDSLLLSFAEYSSIWIAEIVKQDEVFS